ncbi:MAG: 16S rRNA (guanine(966)-N(2))-methyltransferase RsmD [Ruminococcaceae bacterium]|nr:16S rRNA (guanine(966)-N(2))-methyltransferase RsmD [Oscillospiraceae bacterium]
MRVITGTARGVRLLTPEGEQTRPTTDRVKEALFNIIQFDIEGRSVLDLFAGTGQLGIEALSRGAKDAVFVDNRSEAVKLIKENLRKTRMQERSTVFTGDYASFLQTTKQRFDLIFLDPPYAESFLENALKRISTIDIVKDGGIIICERPVEKELSQELSGFERSKDYRYGKTIITLYRKTGT